jgi:MoxR-like ATPase
MEGFTDQPISPPPPPPVSPMAELNRRIHDEAGRVIVGQEELIEQLLVAILADGHVLLEGVPGVAKTLMARTMADLMGVGFKRIQFTPDLMPSDILGTKIFDFSNSTFQTQKGPIFSNIILIDEINRAPAKTQSALLEVMEERQATIEGETFHMDDPFLVMATQNPVEFEGTYSLPEAQMDRFLMKVVVQYPDETQELEIVRRFHQGKLQVGKDRSKGITLTKLLDRETLRKARQATLAVRVEESVLAYINRLVRATRQHAFLHLGASPRGTISLLLASKARAALLGRDFITPDDVKIMAVPVLRHRIMLNPEAEIEGLTPDQILKEIASEAEVPK